MKYLTNSILSPLFYIYYSAILSTLGEIIYFKTYGIGVDIMGKTRVL